LYLNQTEVKRYFFVLFILVAACTACSDIDTDSPDCIKHSIRGFRSTTACDDGANVREYLFQGQMVYVFDPGTCGADMTSEVMDEGCETLGYLGGIAGNMIINGESFTNAVYQRTIWEN